MYVAFSYQYSYHSIIHNSRWWNLKADAQTTSETGLNRAVKLILGLCIVTKQKVGLHQVSLTKVHFVFS